MNKHEATPERMNARYTILVISWDEIAAVSENESRSLTAGARQATGKQSQRCSCISCGNEAGAEAGKNDNARDAHARAGQSSENGSPQRVHMAAQEHLRARRGCLAGRWQVNAGV
jgi:hypothetical protein